MLKASAVLARAIAFLSEVPNQLHSADLVIDQEQSARRRLEMG
jgi:hypothetical protein